MYVLIRGLDVVVFTVNGELVEVNQQGNISGMSKAMARETWRRLVSKGYERAVRITTADLASI